MSPKLQNLITRISVAVVAIPALVFAGGQKPKAAVGGPVTLEFVVWSYNIATIQDNIAQFEKLGIKKEFGSYESLMYYMPFYVVCYQRESNKRYMIIPPSVVSTVGIFMKLKGALGMSKIKRLLTPRFKTVAWLLDSINVLALQNGIFETELNELGAKNNILADAEIRKEIKAGLNCLKSEGWLSDKEFDMIEQRISWIRGN